MFLWSCQAVAVALGSRSLSVVLQKRRLHFYLHRPRCSAVWCPDTLLLLLLHNIPIPEPESVMLHFKSQPTHIRCWKSNSTWLLGVVRDRGGQFCKTLILNVKDDGEDARDCGTKKRGYQLCPGRGVKEMMRESSVNKVNKGNIPRRGKKKST